MIKRDAYDALIRLAGQFPVVAITGPRQSGKTTLARMAFPEKRYVSFDDKNMRELAKSNPGDFLRAFPDGAIIDEAQKVPELFDAIKLIVDNGEYSPGKYILTGSSQFRLKENISDSLAGRIGLIKLLPFSIDELKKEGLLSDDAALTCHSVTGYSGGGKKMIAQYEAGGDLLQAPRQYALGQTHKHLKEMKAISGLKENPIFCPIVSNFYSGMAVTVPLFASQVKGTVDDIRKVYAGLYTGPVVTYRDQADEEGFFSAAALSGKDAMEITVAGNADRILLLARYDNLGKGASGAAVQCLNLALGTEQTLGLEL